MDGGVSSNGKEAGPGALRVRRLGMCDYEPTLGAMRDYTNERTADSADELWLLEHPPVYTLGRAGRREHVLAPGRIPVVATDRGGQVTWHGPGQLVIYTLLDLRRLGLGARALVEHLEQAVIDALEVVGRRGERSSGAPGVYVEGRKLASIGLRVRRGCTYHGISINVEADLAPFRGIDPCGYAGLEMTCLRDLDIDWTLDETGERFVRALLARDAFRGVAPSWESADGERGGSETTGSLPGKMRAETRAAL